MDTLRNTLRSETAEIERVREERAAQKSELLAQQSNVMDLSERLQSSQETVDDLVTELVEADKAKGAILSEAFDSCQEAETRREKIEELLEENRALRDRYKSDNEIRTTYQTFRRPATGEAGVLRQTVSNHGFSVL